MPLQDGPGRTFPPRAIRRMAVGLALAGCLWGACSLAFGSGSRSDDLPRSQTSVMPAAQPMSKEESGSDASWVIQEFHYHMAQAQEVFLVWGINGWQPVHEPNRPAGTVIRNSVMHSPMIRDGETFALTVRVKPGVTIQYGFLVAKMRNGSDVGVWDGADRYTFTASEPGVTAVQSAVVVDWFGNPVDRAGLLVVIVLAVCFIGVVAIGVAMMLRAPPGRRDQSSTPYLDLAISSGRVRIAALITVLFAAVGFLALWQHEMWRDELQAWHIAAASSSLSDLLANLRYEGHPALWYVCLYVLTQFSDHPVAMQILHLILASTVIYLFSRYAPFSRLQKLCFAFGYFPLYEYGVISRSYVLGVLGLFAFCALQDRVREGSLTPVLLLAFMANTSAYGAMIALAFGVMAMVDLLTALPSGKRAPRLVLFSLIIGFGVALSLAQTIPPPDSSPRLLKWDTSLEVNRLEWTLAQVWRSYIPIPVQTVAFWNSNILDGMEPMRLGAWQLTSFGLQAAFSIGLLALGTWMLARTPVVMLVYLLASTELLLFMQVKYYGGLRHAGHLFIVFVACLWLSRLRFPTSPARPGHPETWPLPHDSAQPAARRVANVALSPVLNTSIITALFAIQSIVGLMAVQRDLRFSFSAAKEVAQFLRNHHLSDVTLMGSKYYVASAVAFYLNRPMYYPEPDRVGTYSVWNAGRHRVTPVELVRKAEELASRHRQDVVLVLNYDLGQAGNGLIKVGVFDDNIITDERYVLYIKCYAEAETTRSVTPTFRKSDAPAGTGGNGFCS